MDSDLRLDVLTALLGAAFVVTVTPLALGAENVEPASYALCALAGLAFAFRRQAPLLTVATVVAAVCGFVVLNDDGGPVFGTIFVALALLASARPATSDWLPATIATIVTVTVVTLVAVGWSVHLIAVDLLLLAVPKIAADRARTRVLRDAATDAETDRRLVEERLRIAREVHDVVGHGLATIALRAGVAEHLLTKDPDEARAALQAIRDVSKRSLDELGALLGVLRAEAEHRPVPTLGELPRLVDELRGAGMDVELDVTGEPDGVPEVVGTAAYRIVQEALTNVARHAGSDAHTSVKVVRGRRWIAIDVADDGRGAQGRVKEGGGLTGMRERAKALGGTFDARPRRRDGFRVRAALPVRPR
jgi:signal transduction histidine kinase